MQDYEKVNRLIDGLTLFDDDLMSRVFDKNIEATELILRIILGRKITVIRVNGQEEVRNAEVGGRKTLPWMCMHWMKMDRKWTLRCREIPKAPISAGQDTTAVCWIPKC